MQTPVVIGIAGGSGSGKTTVLKRIVNAFGSDQIAVLDHDAYYHDLSHLPPEFVEPSKRKADIIIPRGGHNHVAIHMVLARIRDLLRQVEQEA